MSACKMRLLGDAALSDGSRTSRLVQAEPTALDEVLVVDRDAAATQVLVLSNDTDPNDDPLAISSVTQGSHGTVNIGSGSSFVEYTPDAGYYGSDSFTYTISDGRGGADTASVSVKVMTPHTWTGAGGSDAWATALNWHGGTAPTLAEVAVFDSTCTSNCSPKIYSDTSVGGIEMNTGYSGTIEKVSGAPWPILTVRGNWIQRSGTFNGGDFLVSIEGKFSLEGGVFNAPSNEQFRVIHYGGVDFTFFDWSGGTFNHSNGLLSLGGAINGCGSGTLTIDTHGQTLSVNDLRWSSEGCGVGQFTTFELTAGTVIDVSRDFADQIGEGETLMGGQIHVKRDIVKSYSAGTTNTWFCGDTRLILDGSGAQTISSVNSDTCLYGLEIDKSSGAVTPKAGTTSWGVRTFKLLQGSFTAPSSIFRIVEGSAGTSTVFEIASGQAGNFTSNGGEVIFNLEGQSGGLDTKVLNFHNQTVTFGLVYLQVLGSGGDTISISGGSKMRATDRVAIETGNVNGLLEVEGDLEIRAGATGGTATITMNGPGNRNLVRAGTAPSGHLTIAKDVGAWVTLQDDLTLGSLGQDLLITGGGFDLAGNNLTVNDEILHSGGNFAMLGTESILGTFVPSGSSTVYINGTTIGLPLGNTYVNLRIFGSLTLNTPLSVASLVVNTGGSLSAAGQQIDISGGITADNNFNAGGNTVVLTGAGNHSIGGTVTFFNLTRNTAAASILNFYVGSSVTVSGTLTLSGGVGQLLTVATFVSGQDFDLNLTGAQVLQHLSVRDSNCVSANCAAGATSTDLGGNAGWTF